MADNVTLPGTGAVIAADEVTDATLGTVEVQYTKFMGGALGDTTKIEAATAVPSSSAGGFVNRPASFPPDPTTVDTLLGSFGAVTPSLPVAGFQVAVALCTASSGATLGIIPQYTMDGGTNWDFAAWVTGPMAAGQVAYAPSTGTITSFAAGTPQVILYPPGATHVRLKVTSYTAGSVNYTLRASSTLWLGVLRSIQVIGSTPASTAMAMVVRPLMPTNGTQSQPTMDAAARAGFVQVTDGTNTQPTMDAAARAGFVKITDGTNAQPAGDTAARAIVAREAGTTVTNKVMIVAVRAAGVTSEALLSLVKVVDTTAAGGVTTGIAATSGKTLRILSAHLTCRAGAAAAAWNEVALRLSASANVTTSTQAVAILGTPATAAVSGATASDSMMFGEAGLEISGTELLGASQLSQATTNVISLTLFGYEY